MCVQLHYFRYIYTLNRNSILNYNMFSYRTTLSVIITSALLTLPVIATSTSYVQFFTGQGCSLISGPTYACDGTCHGLDTTEFRNYKSKGGNALNTSIGNLEFYASTDCTGNPNYGKLRRKDACDSVGASARTRRSVEGKPTLYFRCSKCKV